MPAHLRCFLLVALIGAWATSCCHVPPERPGPDQALRSYAAHLRAGRMQQAHQMMSSKSRQAISAKALERFAASGGKKLAKQLAALEALDSTRVELRARVQSPGGKTMVLVEENGAWRVESGPLVPPAGFSPQAALERFLRAIEAGDCEALVACAPPPVRARYEHEVLLAGCRKQLESLRRTAAAVRSGDQHLVRVAPDRYEMAYQRHRKLVVVEYDGRWYVQDL